MQQVLAIVIVLLLVIFTYIPATFLNNYHIGTESVKYTLNLSAKALANSVKVSDKNFQELALGTKREGLGGVEVDKELLLKEFYDVLYKNLLNGEKFDAVRQRLLAKVLVYYDRFHVTDINDHWEAPYFFTYIDQASGRMVYLNSKNSKAYYYDDSGAAVETTLGSIGMNEQEKNELIINKINNIVSQKTHERGLRKGLNIEIYNPYNGDPEYRAKHSYFNVLDGLTFFVVYAEDRNVSINLKEFKYRNYNVVGYTME